MNHCATETIPMFNAMVNEAVKFIAPTLANNYCDESADALVEIWESGWNDMVDEIIADFNQEASQRMKRLDVHYVKRLCAELGGFIQTSMENDW